MGRRKKKGRSARNAQKALTSQEPEALVKAPHSFVINWGRLGKHANALMLNFRKLMEPYTATQLKVQKKNVIKDFIHVAGPLNVTHLVIFTKSEIAMYLRIARLARGPTLTFKIHEYTLSKDVLSSLKKTAVYQKLFEHQPLLVLNNFSGEGLHFKLMITMFQGMFPSISIHKTRLNTIRRCLLINYNSEDKTIDLRHYAIKIAPCGMSKPVKKLVQSKVPDLGQYGDVSEFLIQPGNLSESEIDIDGLTNQVILPQPISSRGNIVSQKSAIRLCELGPRLKLQLVKIEEEIMTGEVLFHEFIKKTPEDIKALRDAQRKKRVLKEKRKAVQEQNVRKKELAKAKKQQANDNSRDSKGESEEKDENGDDNEWYKKEVGENPDEDMLPTRKRKSVRFSENSSPKRQKVTSENVSGKPLGEKKKRQTFQVSKKSENFANTSQKSKYFVGASQNSKKFQDSSEKKSRTPQEALAIRKKRKKYKLKKQVARKKSLKALTTNSKIKSKHAGKKK